MNISSNLEQTVFLYSFDWKETKLIEVIPWIKRKFSNTTNIICKELPNNGDETLFSLFLRKEDLDSFLAESEPQLNWTEEFLSWLELNSMA